MTEPTGYTALDLVGFTDKGSYNAATAYVKNDLVHYSGDIWRCLVDDTTNITPVEGTNWTVFIEAPTNAIEGIIAPIETNPATNSYAVGRQFIYNESLYKVITAITVGDTLVTYEDDPSNANIQLADPVETQLLDFEEKAYSTDDSAETTLANADLVPFYDTSAANKKKMTVANMVGQTVSNPNLLDNPWFTVNQRKKTSYGGSNGLEMSVDRWAIITNPLTVTVDNNGVTLSHYGGSDTLEYFINYFDTKLLSDHVGNNFNLSFMLQDGTIISGTEILPEITSSTQTVISLSLGSGFYGFLVVRETNCFVSIRSSTASATIALRAVKLEKGMVSTLYMDSMPNYALELAKCRASTVDSTDIYANQNYINVGTTNPNILDNPWFSINQRGETSYGGSNGLEVSVDRWAIVTSPLTVTVDDAGITLTHYNTSVSAEYLIQYFESDRISDLVGRTMTLSVLLQDGTIVSGTGLVPTLTSSNQVVTDFDINDYFHIYFDVKDGNCFVSIKSTTGGTSLAIRAIKLELGSVSTLIMDVEPNYQTELLKCQRYFERIGGTANTLISEGIYTSSTNLSTHVNIQPKASNPSVTLTGTAYCWDASHIGSSGIQSTALNSSVIGTDGNGLLAFSVTGATAGNFGLVQFRDTTSYIDFSADL